jgi:hypothetical protein
MLGGCLLDPLWFLGRNYYHFRPSTALKSFLFVGLTGYLFSSGKLISYLVLLFSAGKKIYANSEPNEIVYFRKVSRADFPLKWPRDSPFETEDEYLSYINRYIGGE